MSLELPKRKLAYAGSLGGLTIALQYLVAQLGLRLPESGDEVLPFLVAIASVALTGDRSPQELEGEAEELEASAVDLLRRELASMRTQLDAYGKDLIERGRGLCQVVPMYEDEQTQSLEPVESVRCSLNAGHEGRHAWKVVR